MLNAHDVTFGGSGLDRAHQLRADPAALDRLKQAPGSGVLLLWKGKVLARAGAGEGLDLVRLAPDHKILRDQAAPLFLGCEGQAGIWAADLSGWMPVDQDLGSVGAFLDASQQRHPDLPGEQVFVELRAVMTRLSPRDAELAATAKALTGWHESHGYCARCGAASQVAMSGWQRDCALCGAHHFPRTDPVVIMLVQEGNDLLLGRSPGWPEGMFSLLAGFIEPGETLEAAVRREVAEETGVRVGRVGYVASQPWPFPASLMLGCRAQALSRDIAVDPAELESALWVSRERLAGILAGQDPQIRSPRRGAIAQFLMQNWLADRLD